MEELHGHHSRTDAGVVGYLSIDLLLARVWTGLLQMNSTQPGPLEPLRGEGSDMGASGSSHRSEIGPSTTFFPSFGCCLLSFFVFRFSFFAFRFLFFVFRFSFFVFCYSLFVFLSSFFFFFFLFCSSSLLRGNRTKGVISSQVYFFQLVGLDRNRVRCPMALEQ